MATVSDATSKVGAGAEGMIAALVMPGTGRQRPVAGRFERRGGNISVNSMLILRGQAKGSEARLTAILENQES